MTRVERNLGQRRRWVWVLGTLLVLGGLGALWSCATKELPDLSTMAEDTDVIKTTIRISKGRPGMMSQWEVSIEAKTGTAAEQYGYGAVIPLEVWKRMNGKITSFTEFGCEGKPAAVEELQYQTLNANQQVQSVGIGKRVDGKPAWDFTDCATMNSDCTLPPRYFDPVAEDKSTCDKDQPERVWVIELE